jgi:hypothetical protein
MKSIPDMLTKYAPVHVPFSWRCATTEKTRHRLDFLGFCRLAANQQRIVGMICSAAGSERADCTASREGHLTSSISYSVNLNGDRL